MDPRAERQIERLCSLLERLLDRAFLEEHDKLKTETVLLRVDVNRIIERAEKLEEASENTGSIYLADMKEKLKDREKSGETWVRYVVATVVTLAFMAGSAVLGWLTHGR